MQVDVTLAVSPTIVMEADPVQHQDPVQHPIMAVKASEFASMYIREQMAHLHMWEFQTTLNGVGENILMIIVYFQLCENPFVHATIREKKHWQ